MAATVAPDIAPVERLKQVLGDIEVKVLTGYTLADAIREGASVTEPTSGAWIAGDRACALGAGWVAAKARGYVV